LFFSQLCSQVKHKKQETENVFGTKEDILISQIATPKFRFISYMPKKLTPNQRFMKKYWNLYKIIFFLVTSLAQHDFYFFEYEFFEVDYFHFAFESSKVMGNIRFSSKFKNMELEKGTNLLCIKTGGVVFWKRKSAQ
jgi:hypothetical protein